MPHPRRITQQDVAKIAGVNRATVSLALHSHPSIPKATRERIRKIVTKLGYVPDPMLTALATYRNSRRPATHRGTLGWLARTTREFAWKKIPHFSAYLDAAQRRAEEHGYRIEVFDLQEDGGVTWKRATTVARTRGIEGVLLCPQPRADTNVGDFGWEQFAAVTFGYSLLKPRLSLIAPAQYAAAFKTTLELFERGYRRVGFAFERDHDQRTRHHFLAGFLAARTLQAPKDILPILIEDDLYTTRESLWRWMKQHRPDAVVTCDTALHLYAEKRGLACPAEIGFACPILNRDSCDMAGICEDDNRIGEAAVDMLVSMLHRGERGLRDCPQQMLIEGTWNEGRTLRAR
jgi:DNA-binding LacI/PurR family transcriptional regulator